MRPEEVKNNISVEDVKDKVEEMAGDAAEKTEGIIDNAKEKIGDVINNLTENETVQNLKEKVEDAIENIKNSETVEKVAELAKEHGVNAEEIIETAAKKVESTGIWQRIKGFFGK